jgi:hypothetical protein
VGGTTLVRRQHDILLGEESSETYGSFSKNIQSRAAEPARPQHLYQSGFIYEGAVRHIDEAAFGSKS